jgi:hypothetical protein
MRSLVIEDEPQIGAYLGRLLGQLDGIVDIVGCQASAWQFQVRSSHRRPVYRKPYLR